MFFPATLENQIRSQAGAKRIQGLWLCSQFALRIPHLGRIHDASVDFVREKLQGQVETIGIHASRLEGDAVRSGFRPRYGAGILQRGRSSSCDALPAVYRRAGKGFKHRGVAISIRMHRGEAGVHVHKKPALFFAENIETRGKQGSGLGVPEMTVGFDDGGPHADDLAIEVLLRERLGEGLPIDLAPACQIDEADLVEGIADLRHLFVKHPEPNWLIEERIPCRAPHIW